MRTSQHTPFGARNRSPLTVVFIVEFICSVLIAVNVSPKAALVIALLWVPASLYGARRLFRANSLKGSVMTLLFTSLVLGLVWGLGFVLAKPSNYFQVTEQRLVVNLWSFAITGWLSLCVLGYVLGQRLLVLLGLEAWHRHKQRAVGGEVSE
jgi:hypothetical protein